MHGVRWVGDPKMSIFVHVQGKTVHIEVGGWAQKGQNHAHVVIE